MCSQELIFLIQRMNIDLVSAYPITSIKWKVECWAEFWHNCILLVYMNRLFVSVTHITSISSRPTINDFNVHVYTTVEIKIEHVLMNTKIVTGIYGFLELKCMKHIENNVSAWVTNCFSAHERVILVFVFRVARGIHAKITLEWTQKQFVTRVHTLLFFLTWHNEGP